MDVRCVYKEYDRLEEEILKSGRQMMDQAYVLLMHRDVR